MKSINKIFLPESLVIPGQRQPRGCSVNKEHIPAWLGGPCLRLGTLDRRERAVSPAPPPPGLVRAGLITALFVLSVELRHLLHLMNDK